MKKVRIAALISAILAFVCAYMVINSAGSGSSGAVKLSGDTVQVVAAAVDIGSLETITADKITLKTISASDYSEEYFTSAEEAEGLCVSSDIYIGEIISKRRTLGEGSQGMGIASLIEPGKRAVTINVDSEQGVGSNLRAGNYVDVVCRLTLDGGSANGQNIPAWAAVSSAYGPGKPSNSAYTGEFADSYMSSLYIQDLKVLSTGSSADGSYDCITLEMTPRQAEEIILMNDFAGSVYFILRNQEDHDAVNESAEYLFSH